MPIDSALNYNYGTATSNANSAAALNDGLRIPTDAHNTQSAIHHPQGMPKARSQPLAMIQPRRTTAVLPPIRPKLFSESRVLPAKVAPFMQEMRDACERFHVRDIDGDPIFHKEQTDLLKDDTKRVPRLVRRALGHVASRMLDRDLGFVLDHYFKFSASKPEIILVALNYIERLKNSEQIEKEEIISGHRQASLKPAPACEFNFLAAIMVADKMVASGDFAIQQYRLLPKGNVKLRDKLYTAEEYVLRHLDWNANIDATQFARQLELVEEAIQELGPRI